MARRRADGSFQTWLPLMSPDQKARNRGWSDAGKAGLTLADNPYRYARPASQWADGFRARRQGRDSLADQRANSRSFQAGA